MKSRTLTLILSALAAPALAQSPTVAPIPPRAVPATPAVPATSAIPATPATAATPPSEATPAPRSPALDTPNRAVVLTQETAIRGADVSVSSRPNDPISAGYRPAFRALDTDQDGELSRAEAAKNPTVLAQFVVLDRDRNRALSRAETDGVIN